MKKNRVITTTITVSLIVIISKLIGFGREAIIAAFFGANEATDAFFLAQSMPAMIFPAVCSSISTAFLSVYIKKSVNDGEESGNRFASRAIVVTLLIAAILSIIAYIIMPYIIPVFAPGFNSNTIKIAIILSRITMASFILIMGQYMFIAILNSKKHFHGPQVSGIAGNVFIILITLFFGKDQSVRFLTWTVVGGLIIQIILLLLMASSKIKFVFKKKILDKDICFMIRLAIPILLGNSVIQINTIVDKALASKLAEGAVSALSYSTSLNSIVISVFIMSLSTVLYPTLTENVSNNDKNNFSNNLFQNLKMLVLLIVPISIITVIYSYDIVSFVYQRVNFNSIATQLTSNALAFYALGYTFVAIREVIIRGFYALGDSKTPMYNGIFSVCLNIIFSIILVHFMGISGIAFGSSIAVAISAIFLLFSMNKRMAQFSPAIILPTIMKVLLAAIITLTMLYIFSMVFTSSIPLLRFILATFLGFAVYIIILVILNCWEIKKLLKMIKNKIVTCIKSTKE